MPPSSFRTAVIVAMIALAADAQSPPRQEQGRYFSRKVYNPSPLPKFQEIRGRLPSPIHESEGGWVEVYWRAWELAFRNFHEPAPGTGFVSQFIDAAFNENIFLWDTCFMTMFCSYAHLLTPGIGSLDNFYAKQYPDGEISREIVRQTGADFPPWLNRERGPLLSRWGYRDGGKEVNAPVKYVGRSAPEAPPFLTLDALNHPVLAWAELESYRTTGDKARLAGVWEPLKQYFASLRTYLRQGNGLYMTDWASMDNSPRNPCLEGGGAGVDISAEMVMFARQLVEIAAILGKTAEAAELEREAGVTARQINRLMWDPKQQFYFDLSVDGKRCPVKTIAAYWTLLAGVAGPSQAKALVQELKNPKTFGRRNPVPTCSAADPGYDPKGGYWRGAVWVPTTTMVIRGLEKYGYRDLARRIALDHLRLVSDVFQRTGTIWENYAPDAAEPGQPARKDFVGWGGLAPIRYLLEYGIGLTTDPQKDEITWRLSGSFKHGCERFRFNGHVVSLIAEPERAGSRQMRVRIESDSAFQLRLQLAQSTKVLRVSPGRQEFTLP